MNIETIKKLIIIGQPLLIIGPADSSKFEDASKAIKSAGFKKHLCFLGSQPYGGAATGFPNPKGVAIAKAYDEFIWKIHTNDVIVYDEVQSYSNFWLEKMMVTVNNPYRKIVLIGQKLPSRMPIKNINILRYHGTICS